MAALQGTTLTLPLSEVRQVGEGKVLHAKLEPVFRDVLLSPQADGSVLAITAECSHNACIVDFKPATREWECPCHDSRFSTEGVVKVGPAKKNLLVPPSRVEGEQLVVDLGPLKR